MGGLVMNKSTGNHVKLATCVIVIIENDALIRPLMEPFYCVLFSE
ncbi:hypothetical protein Celal_3881 [Cellulophaga algicola DSM 14237]|uniref:Uncharacterized protein n=1 Tax=Cellulophaga algicola (strain DSM 14237 / IC166 / ACAM 630) TaxID=688270 RepID=E6XC73_CELAD|nr:hypothetical protein Celal_3881 [Cellulophaga algicola DSM 14237]